MRSLFKWTKVITDGLLIFIKMVPRWCATFVEKFSKRFTDPQIWKEYCVHNYKFCQWTSKRYTVEKDDRKCCKYTSEIVLIKIVLPAVLI